MFNFISRERDKRFMRKEILKALYPAIFILILSFGYISNISRRHFLYSAEAKGEILLLLPAIIIVVIASAYNLYTILSDNKSKTIRIACFILFFIICSPAACFSYSIDRFGYSLVYALLLPFIFYDIYRTAKV